MTFTDRFYNSLIVTYLVIPRPNTFNYSIIPKDALAFFGLSALAG